LLIEANANHLSIIKAIGREYNCKNKADRHCWEKTLKEKNLEDIMELKDT
jgi:hypothetical protein